MLIELQPRFKDAVQNGSKTQIIRPLRKHNQLPARGQKLFLHLKRLRDARRDAHEVVCRTVKPILIHEDWMDVGTRPIRGQKALSDHAIKAGFSDWNEMRDWFSKNHSLPFFGYLIEWYPPPPSENEALDGALPAKARFEAVFVR